MIQIHLSYMKCNEETNEAGSDEPYILAVAVPLTPSVPVVPVQAPITSDVVLYQFAEVNEDDRPRFGIFESFWGIGGVPATLLDPNNAIFVIAMMENDDGDPAVSRGIVNAAVDVSLAESLAVARPGKVGMLIRDVDSARRIPTGFPSFDDAVGAPQELRFSADELQRAENGQIVTKTMVFEGDCRRLSCA